MTNPSIARPDPLAAIIAFGKPSSADLPQASWFKAEDIQAVKVAAEQLKFSVIELRTEADKALAIGVHEGVLKGSGRMIVGSVTPEVYRRIEEYGRKAPGADPAPASKSHGDASSGPSATGDAKASPGGASAPAPAAAPEGQAAAPSPSSPWDSLRVGGTVLTAYWNEKKELEGFWPAVITRAEKNEFVLKWRDTPEYTLGKVERKHIAILHPEFLASGK
jgi:hypothetical protein